MILVIQTSLFIILCLALAIESINTSMFLISSLTKQTKEKQARHLKAKMHTLILFQVLLNVTAHFVVITLRILQYYKTAGGHIM